MAEQAETYLKSLMKQSESRLGTQMEQLSGSTPLTVQEIPDISKSPVWQDNTLSGKLAEPWKILAGPKIFYFETPRLTLRDELGSLEREVSYSILPSPGLSTCLSGQNLRALQPEKRDYAA